MTKLTSEQITAAVEWWADKLKSCKQSGLSPEERSDSANDGYQIAEMMMTLNRPKITDQQICTFSRTLTELLGACSESDPFFNGVLSVDYGPDQTLAKALDSAGIPLVTGVLPIKTVMWLRDGGVRVRYGYGAEVKDVLAIPASE